jgi:uncharacterized protein (DUF1778 family)
MRKDLDMRHAARATGHKSNSHRTGTINIRTTSSDRTLIDRAAATQGKTRSDFMLEAARREAIDTILNQTLFQVDAVVYKRFVTMLDSPPKDNAKLRTLMQTKAPWESPA